MLRTATKYAIATAVLGSVGVVASTAQASCPPIVNDNYSALKISSYNNNHSHTTNTYLGRIIVFGTYILAAGIEDYTDGTCLVRAIVDETDSALTGLPKTDNQLCMGGGADEVHVVTSNVTVCGTTFYSFNYAGRRLLLDGESGGDELNGGNGVEVIEGSGGNDVVWDGSSSGYFGELRGGLGNDQLYGSPANTTYLYGDPGADTIVDDGGIKEHYDGGDDNDCLYDSNGSFAYLHCGDGTDKTNMSGGWGCEQSAPAWCR